MEVKTRVHSGLHPNVQVSRDYFDTPERAERVCTNVDIGLAWYDGGLSPNFDTAALSSGKVAAYLKHGLPLIVRRGGSFVEVLEQSGCAIAIQTPLDLPFALDYIERNYIGMSGRALEKFDTCYKFENYEEPLAAFLGKAVNQDRAGEPKTGRVLAL